MGTETGGGGHALHREIKKQSPWRWFCSKFAISIIFIVYSLVGSAIFLEMEQQFDINYYTELNADMTNRSADVDTATQALINELIADDNASAWTLANVTALLQNYTNYVADSIQNHNYPGAPWTNATPQIPSTSPWSYTAALLFNMGVVTASGAGPLAPRTDTARLFIIPYTIVGMLLFMLFLADFGGFMTQGLHVMHTNLVCMNLRRRRREAQRAQQVYGRARYTYFKIWHRAVYKINHPTQKQKMKFKAGMAGASTNAKNKADVPFFLSFGMTLLTLILGGVFFAIWEQRYAGTQWSFCVGWYYAGELTNLIPGGYSADNYDLTNVITTFYIVVGLCMITIMVNSIAEMSEQYAAAKVAAKKKKEKEALEAYNKSTHGILAAFKAQPTA